MAGAEGPIKRLLVIDDDPDFVELLRAVLKAEPIDFHARSCGEEGLEAAAALKPDLIVLDMFMPGIHGLHALKRLREEPATAETPVLLTTNMDGSEIEVEAAEASADFLSKRADIRVAAARIRRALGLV